MWDQLWPTDYPFTRHAFLAVLENSASIDSPEYHNSGWIPRHLTVTQDEHVIAAMPLFIKLHSYGEYVFDWSWADAYAQTGLNYYPKLINAIPFTPATGPRLAIASSLSATEQNTLATQMLQHIDEYAQQQGLSGFHSLFPDRTAQKYLTHSTTAASALACRQGCQFHWFNQGFENFDDFLQSFSSRKRKNVRKERRVAQSHGFNIRLEEGGDISEDDWYNFYLLYQRTYLKRSGHGGYLGKDFFLQLAQTMPQHLAMASVRENQQLIAAALFFKDSTTLYGRYWGTRFELDQLHFEACYYQGIDYAIAQKLQRFDPGAQGEHKIQRGFTPILTSSYHRLYHPEFHAAVEQFVRQEKLHNQHYLDDCRTSLPFKEGSNTVPPEILISA